MELENDFVNITLSSDENEINRVAVIQANMVIWIVVDSLLMVIILFGNILTILAVVINRKLRVILSNFFIVSLAISDILVGITLPFHSAFYMAISLGRDHILCMSRFFLIIVACGVSIWNLISIAVDRYIAVLYPLHYTRYMTKKMAIILVSIGWIVGSAIASVPLVWNNFDTSTQCEFTEILPTWYMIGVITPTFSMVWLSLIILYFKIWREATRHAKQMRASFSGPTNANTDWKTVQVVLLVLGCFSVCWLPYFVVACAQLIQVETLDETTSPIVYKTFFSLAIANSGMNPIIYAWKNRNFRYTFGQLLKCRNPNAVTPSCHSISNVNAISNQGV